MFSTSTTVMRDRISPIISTGAALALLPLAGVQSRRPDGPGCTLYSILVSKRVRFGSEPEGRMRPSGAIRTRS
jgi:hypothetical protein